MDSRHTGSQYDTKCKKKKNKKQTNKKQTKKPPNKQAKETHTEPSNYLKNVIQRFCFNQQQ